MHMHINNLFTPPQHIQLFDIGGVIINKKFTND